MDALKGLAWPLWQRRIELRQRAAAVPLAGGAAAAGGAFGIGWALGLPPELLASLPMPLAFKLF